MTLKVVIASTILACLSLPAFATSRRKQATSEQSVSDARWNYNEQGASSSGHDLSGYQSDCNSGYQSVNEDHFHDSALRYPISNIESQEAEYRLANWQPNVYEPPSPPEEHWIPNRYNIYNAKVGLHYDGPRIRRPILDPSEYYPSKYYRRLQYREYQLKNGDLNNRQGQADMVLYDSQNANEKALFDAMREISINDDQHGIVAVPSEGAIYYNSNMTKEDFMQRIETAILPILETNPRDKYLAYQFCKP